MIERDGFIEGVPCWIDLSVPDAASATAFYGGLFGWEVGEPQPMMGGAAWARLPGYGDFLSIRDPGLRERQESEGGGDFADVVASLAPLPA